MDISRIDIRQIEDLVRIIEHSSLTEFSLRDGQFKMKMAKREGRIEIQTTEGMEADRTVPEDEEEDFITSPIVGTFYAASSPDMPPFVKQGDRVKAGQPVCILEAMKLMNEISSDFDCEIEAVLVSNEQKVEYGQPMFKIKRL